MIEGIFYGICLLVFLAVAYVAYLEIEAEYKRLVSDREQERKGHDSEVATRTETETHKGTAECGKH